MDWRNLIPQLDRYAEQRKQKQAAFAQQRGLFLDYLIGDLSPQWQKWKERAADPAHRHLIPDFDEAPGQTYPVDFTPVPAMYCASDGSQIFPNRHEIDSVALLNISRIRLNYVYPQAPQVLDSEATLMIRDEWEENLEIPFQSLVSDARTLRELETLADLAQTVAEENLPGIALSDGSLIVWRLAGRALESYEEKIVLRYVESLLRFQTCGVPVAGYISQSGSREVVQLLTLVDQEKAKQFDPKLGLTDTALMSKLLQPGQRSIVFHSRSQILAWYGEQAISFFYLHVGSEVARIEIPRWLASNPSLLDRIAAWCWFQARLAGGYPMILSEAHEHAVVRGPDREMFYALLEQSFLRQGIAPSPSPKQWSKRVPMV